MHNRGVSFVVPQRSTNLLETIFEGVNIQTMYWYNVESQNEVWSMPPQKDFFEKEIYTGDCFFKQISMPHFIIFLKLQAYANEEKFEDIHTYEDFLRSNCILLLLIYDCENVEVFTKDDNLTETIMKNAQRNGFLEIELITCENDGRVKMDVL